MPQPAPAKTGSSRGERSLRLFTAADLDELTARAGLAPARRLKIRAAAAVLGFGVTSYVADELIDWAAAPDDPIYRLVFPDEDMLDGPGMASVAELLHRGTPGRQVAAAARQVRGRLMASGSPRFGEQVLPGVHRSYHDTVSVYAPRGPAGRTYGSAFPGWAWPGRTPGPAMAVADASRLAGYLSAHPQVSIVEFTGTDALTLDAGVLRRYIEPLLEIEQLASVRLGTAALARWPHRFLTDPDADDVLRLFEQVSARGKSLTVMANFSHPRELEPGPAADAVARLRSSGAVICTQAPLAGSVNDAASVWAGMWRKQVRMGMVPYAMAVQRVTGPARHFRVPLARAQQIFAHAYGSVSGLCRTVRGPAMRGEHGTVCVEGTAEAGPQKMFVLRYLQARDPHLAGGPFFAAFDADAAWLTDLQPVPGARFPSPAAASGR